MVVTSKLTGVEPKTDDLEKVKKATALPVLIGSGMTPENISEFMPLGDGFIVGSVFRKDGKFLGDTEDDRVKKFVNAFDKERKKYI